MKEHANYIGLRLLMEGSVLGLLLEAWLWGILTLGAHHAMVAQLPPPQRANTSQGTWLPAPVCTAPRRGSGQWAAAMAEPAGALGRSGPIRAPRASLGVALQSGRGIQETTSARRHLGWASSRRESCWLPTAPKTS